MDFSWTEEQLKLYNETLAFAKKNLDKPLDNSEETFRKKWKECADYGIQGIFCPEDYGPIGGSGLGIQENFRRQGGFCMHSSEVT